MAPSVFFLVSDVCSCWNRSILLILQTRECNFFCVPTADCVGTKYEEHESEQQDLEALTGVSTGCSLLAEEVEGEKKVIWCYSGYSIGHA